MDRSHLTIAAPITPKGIGAVAGIRISGSDALSVIRPFLPDPYPDLQPGKLVLTKLLHQGSPIDEVTVCYRKAPHSYTGEDTIEIFCHGGWVMPSLIMSLLLENGAVYAEPGEFSKRAMENGKLDLIQVEAIQQIVQARTKQEVILAGSNLFGKFQDQIKDLSNRMIEIKSFIEAQISFPMDTEEERFPLVEKINQLDQILSHLLQQADQSAQFKSGYEVLIVGKTNAGKSSLFNALLGWDRMMVSPYPSTTHDYVMELIDLHGYPLYLVDSAGYVRNGKELDDIFNKTLPGKIQQAFLTLFVLDASCFESEDLDLIEMYKDQRKIIVINKVDLNDAFPTKFLSEKFPEIPVTIVSSVTKEGLYELMEEVYNQIQIANPEQQDYYMNERHQYSLKQCSAVLKKTLQNIQEGFYLDMIASDIERAGQWLEELLGTHLQEAAYQKIFETFCIGK